MSALDPRTTLARPDLADLALEGLVRAERFAAPVAMQASTPILSVRARPEGDAEQVDQLVFGEVFDVLEERGGWAWGRARRDGFVGWTLAEGLSQPVLAPTHRVAAIRTYAYPDPDAKASPVGLLSLNALVTEEAREGAFVRCARIGWIAAPHLADLAAFERDPVAVAERFVGAPYQWGGRESLGLDGPALVQQALYACGRACPRSADEQTELGRPVPLDDLRRGDLVFWPGHVALVAAPGELIHADRAAMAVAREPLASVAARFGSPPTDARRVA